MWVDLFSLIFILHLWNQFCRIIRYSWRWFVAVWIHLLEDRIVVWSAKVARIKLFECGMSEVKRLYRVGARMLPWGTPAFIGWVDESSSLQRTWNVLFKRKNLIVRNRGAGRKWILYSWPLCQTRSKSSATSRNTTVQ